MTVNLSDLFDSYQLGFDEIAAHWRCSNRVDNIDYAKGAIRVWLHDFADELVVACVSAEFEVALPSGRAIYDVGTLWNVEIDGCPKRQLDVSCASDDYMVERYRSVIDMVRSTVGNLALFTCLQLICSFTTQLRFSRLPVISGFDDMDLDLLLECSHQVFGVVKMLLTGSFTAAVLSSLELVFRDQTPLKPLDYVNAFQMAIMK